LAAAGAARFSKRICASANGHAIKPGDAVTIHGLRAAAIPLLQATSITDHASARTIIDTGPGLAGPPQLSGSGAGTVEVRGSVRMRLHGARGEINGVLLTDGTILRLPPDAAANMETLLQPRPDAPPPPPPGPG
jgi:hypothetical protein